MTKDNNSNTETIEGEEVKAQPKKRRDEVEALTKCKVLKSFRLTKGPIIRKYLKNPDGLYITHKVELKKSGAIRHERTTTVIELNIDDMKEALKMKAIEIVDD